MMNFSTARQAMVKSQIQPCGVTQEDLLSAYETLPREHFVPEALRKIAYRDEDIALGDGRVILDPTLHARMAQVLAPALSETVLDVGGTYGYSAAILSRCVRQVVMLEDQEIFLQHAAQNFEQQDIGNVECFLGQLRDGVPDRAPYDAILVNGAVAEIPVNLVRQLRPLGHMVVVIRPAGALIGHVTLCQMMRNGALSTTTVFEASCPYLPGCAPQPAFAF